MGTFAKLERGFFWGLGLETGRRRRRDGKLGQHGKVWKGEEWRSEREWERQGEVG